MQGAENSAHFQLPPTQKSQWFYMDGFMSLTPMTHIAAQLSEKALTLKSNCFQTHAHYVKRANIYSIIAGSFNTRILR